MKLLNGYIYWPDVILILLTLWNSICLILLVRLIYKAVRTYKPDDEVIKQEISDKLDKVLNKIKSIIKN